MAGLDQLPQTIEFQFDRRQLVRYNRVSTLLTWWMIFSAFSLFAFIQPPEFWLSDDLTLLSKVGYLGFRFGIGLTGALVLGLLVYFPYFHISAASSAQNVRLLVDGPYLRVVQGGYFVTDRRFHFRDVNMYTTSHGPLMRWFGLQELSFEIETTAKERRVISVTGILNPEQTRDLLCEIDISRETTGNHQTTRNTGD